jgi:hypothetical protein
MLRLNTKQLPEDSPLAPALNYVLERGIRLYPIDEYNYESRRLPIIVELDVYDYCYDKEILYLTIKYGELSWHEASRSCNKKDINHELIAEELFNRGISALNTIIYRNEMNEIDYLIFEKLSRVWNCYYWSERVVNRYRLVFKDKYVLYESDKIIYEWVNKDDFELTVSNFSKGTAPEILYLLENE